MLTLVTLLLCQAEVVRTLEGGDVAPWARIEVLEDKRTKFVDEKYIDSTRHQEFKIYGGGVVRAFGSAAPPPNRSLFHHAPVPAELKHDVPVLLVHGAGADATLTYFAKNIGGEAGLAPFLVEQGYRVFAVTFPVSQGDNIGHAVHLAHAVERALELSGAKRLDVLAHSMGGLAARAYLAGFDARIPRYKGQVRRLILSATPNEGCDITFRHPVAYLWFRSYGFPAPWTKRDGKDVTEESIFGGSFLGHLQMQADLRSMHALTEREDHVLDTYVGNKFDGTYSPGILAAIKQGGDFIKRLNQRAMPPGVELFLIAGTDNTIRYYDKAGQIKTQIGEYDGPSDGIVFVKSALATNVWRDRKANVKERLEVHVPHFEMVYADEIKKSVDAWLSRPYP